MKHITSRTRSADKLEISIGPQCFNNCCFCSEGGRGTRGYMPLAEARKILKTHSHAHKVVFNGGEPTTNKDFFRYLALAKKTAARQIGVVTSGEWFGERAFFDRAVREGMNMIMFSLQSGDEKTHDTIVGRRGAHARLMRALGYALKTKERMLRASPDARDVFRIHIHTCMHRLNYREIPFLVNTMVSQYPLLDQYILQTMEVTGNAARNITATHVRYTTALAHCARHLNAAAPLIRRKVRIESATYCMAPQALWPIVGWRDSVTSGEEANYSDQDAQLLLAHIARNKGSNGSTIRTIGGSFGKSYGKPCKHCAARRFCDGIWKLYVLRNGWGEFKPITGPKAIGSLMRRRDIQKKYNSKGSHANI